MDCGKKAFHLSLNQTSIWSWTLRYGEALSRLMLLVSSPQGCSKTRLLYLSGMAADNGSSEREIISVWGTPKLERHCICILATPKSRRHDQDAPFGPKEKIFSFLKLKGGQLWRELSPWQLNFPQGQSSVSFPQGQSSVSRRPEGMYKKALFYFYLFI